jgi:hypothetical protein
LKTFVAAELRCSLQVRLLWGIYEAIWGAKKRKLQYLPPKFQLKGMGSNVV